MELDDALSRIADIHRQMAKTEQFRGYRSATAAASAVTAAVAGVLQTVFIPAPAEQFASFLQLWIGVAAINITLVTWAIAARYWPGPSATPRVLTLEALEQFAPSVLAGAIATLAVARSGGEIAASLPAWWSLLFGLGLLATRRLLPPGIVFVAVFYFFWGVLGLSTVSRAWPLAPWYMAFGFGTGQAASAVVLHWALERRQ